MRTKPSNLRDVAILKATLLSQLPRLIESVFTGRHIHRTAHEYRIGTHGSISIRIADGSYFNHETGEGGDILSLVQHAMRMDFKGTLAWVHDFIGHHHAVLATAPLQMTKINARAAHQRGKALSMLKRSVPIINTLAERYLRRTRGITIEPLPESLRFISHAYNFTGGGFYPAMIAPILNTQGEIIAMHCTFLDSATGAKLQGGSIKSRLIIGSCRGGAIRLSPATERLALCEGIEDGLSIIQCADWPVWTTGGTSNLRSVQIPSQVREVMICADADAAGMQAAHDLSLRLVTDGKRVRIATPPSGFKDYNDLLKDGGYHAE